MPVTKLPNGSWEAITKDGTRQVFETRKEARDFASGKFVAAKCEEGCGCHAPIPAPAPNQDPFAHILPNHFEDESTRWKAKNTRTGNIVELSRRSYLHGTFFFVAGVRFDSFFVALNEFKLRALRMGATVLERVSK
jgi:hypothetical protein